MGVWTLQSATPEFRDRNDIYGNYFSVHFVLKYDPSTFGSFKEMPRLEWQETILMIEKLKGTYWQHTADQYARNPGSLTFTGWVSRYKTAHWQVRQGNYGNDQPTRLYDKRRSQLKRDAFPRIQSEKDKADAVRAYLKSHGGIVDILVIDKPGINLPTAGDGTHKERILTFDCGLAGCGPRVYAYQHLLVDAAVPNSQWRRKCEMSRTTSPFSTSGLTRLTPPADVTIVKPYKGSTLNGDYQ